MDDRLILRRKGRAARISYFVDEARNTDFAELADEYSSLRATAPRRTKNYLEPARNSRAAESVTRGEERLAALLVQGGKNLVLSDQVAIRLLDFQVPLRAVRADASVGKIDLFGVSDRIVVVELKIARARGAGDTPLSALLEALVYAAIVEANYERFLYDLRVWDMHPICGRPGLLVLGDGGYWRYWDYTPAARGWRSALTEFLNGLNGSIGSRAWLGALPDDWETPETGAVSLTDPLDAQTNP
jgi:hypothetical protein